MYSAMAPVRDGNTAVAKGSLLSTSSLAASSLPGCAALVQRRPRLLAGAALLLALLALAIGLGVGLGRPAAPAAPAYHASAAMVNSTLGVSGTVLFSSASASGPVTVTISLQGFAAGPDTLHGLHVHASVLSPTMPLDGLCAAAGSHLNPLGVTHGCPGVPGALHAGDLGSVLVSGGKVQATLSSSTISLDPAASNSVVNRALVLHALEDDCGLGGESDSKTTGHSGARIVCAVILAGPAAS